MLGLDGEEIRYLVCGMIKASVRPSLRQVKFFALGLAIFSLVGSSISVQAATAPAFGDLRGTYRGIERIVIKKNGKRTLLSAPVKVVSRLSRGKKSLQIEVEGNFIRNNKRGAITSNYTISENGRALFRLRDKLNNDSVKAKGTGNLRRKGGRFTALGRGYGLTGLVNGNLRLRGSSLQIRQTLRDGTDTVTFSVLVTRRSKK